MFFEKYLSKKNIELLKYKIELPIDKQLKILSYL